MDPAAASPVPPVPGAPPPPPGRPTEAPAPAQDAVAGLLGARTESPRATALALLALCALFLALTLPGLGDRGLVLPDEASHLLEGRFFAGAIRSIPDVARLWWRGAGAAIAAGAAAGIDGAAPDATAGGDGGPGLGAPASDAALRDRVAARVASGLYPIRCKPTHSGLIGLALLLCGDVDWAGSVVGMAFGGATLILVFAMARRAYGVAGALFGGLLFLLAPLWLYLSRGALAETDSTFFFLLAIALTDSAVRGRPRPRLRLLAAGVALGLCVSIHGRLAFALPATALLLAAGFLDPAGAWKGRRLSALAWLGIGTLLPLLLWELAFVAGYHALGYAPSFLGYPTYFERHLYFFTTHMARDFGFGDARFLLLYARDFVGWPLVLCAAVGLAAAAWDRRRTQLLAAALPLAWCLGFFLLRTREQCVRYLAPALPFLALAAAATPGVVTRWTARLAWSPPRRAALAGATLLAVAAAAVACAAPALAALAEDRSGAAEAFGALRDLRAAAPAPAPGSGAGLAYLCEDLPYAWYYDPPPHHHAFLAPPTLEEFRAGVLRGARYLVVTPGSLAFYAMPPYFDRLLQELHRRAPPVEVDHPAGAGAYFAAEHALYGVRSMEDWRVQAEHVARLGGKIRIYDLQTLFR